MTEPEQLSDDLAERAQAIADIRLESVEAVLDRFDLERIRAAPKRFSPTIPLLREVEFADVGMEDGLAYVSLADGTRLYGLPSMPSHEKAYSYVSDLLPPGVGAETFLTALDVAYRVLTDSGESR